MGTFRLGGEGWARPTAVAAGMSGAVALVAACLAVALTAGSAPMPLEGDVGSSSGPRSGPPLSFVPNRGQTDARVRYQAQTAGLGVFLTADHARISLERGERGHALDLRFLGANPDPAIVAERPRKGRVSYIGGAQR